LATQEEAAVHLLANEPERAACLEAEPVEEARQKFLEGEAARSRIERRQRQQVGMHLAELRAGERGLGLRVVVGGLRSVAASEVAANCLLFGARFAPGSALKLDPGQD
jgi:hypothetical protein